MNDPFEVKERVYANFGLLDFEVEEVQGDKGPFYRFNVTVAPLDGGDLVTRGYTNFATYTPNDTKIFLDSLHSVSPNPMGVKGRFVEWQWKAFRDYGKKTISYYEKNNADKLQADEKGRMFVEKYAIQVVKVFNSEDEAIAASNAASSVQQAGDPFSTNGGRPSGDTPPTGFDDESVAKQFLGPFVKMALGDDHKVDREKLAGLIASNDILAKHYTIDSGDVVAEIEALEASPPF